MNLGGCAFFGPKHSLYSYYLSSEPDLPAVRTILNILS